MQWRRRRRRGREDCALCGPRPLTESGSGCVVRIAHVGACDEDSCRLRELGLYEGAEVEVLWQGDPIVLCIRGTRFAVSRRCARLVTGVRAA